MAWGVLDGSCMHCKAETTLVGTDAPTCMAEHQCCGACEGALKTCTDAAIRAKYFPQPTKETPCL